MCDDGQLRIMNSTEQRSGTQSVIEGNLEICYNNTYGAICDTFWDDSDAMVSCNELGFSPNGNSQRVYSLASDLKCNNSIGSL